VLAGDAGILLGALASTQVKMSRGRTLLIDLGGVLGTMAGGLVAIGTNSQEGAGTSLLVGTGAGLALAAVFTREWDVDPDVGSARVIPTRAADGQGWGVALAFER
jgi:hypothetical protein